MKIVLLFGCSALSDMPGARTLGFSENHFFRVNWNSFLSLLWIVRANCIWCGWNEFVLSPAPLLWIAWIKEVIASIISINSDRELIVTLSRSLWLSRSLVRWFCLCLGAQTLRTAHWLHNDIFAHHTGNYRNCHLPACFAIDH